jgi:hypothetical protein
VEARASKRDRETEGRCAGFFLERVREYLQEVQTEKSLDEDERRRKFCTKSLTEVTLAQRPIPKCEQERKGRFAKRTSLAERKSRQEENPMVVNNLKRKATATACQPSKRILVGLTCWRCCSTAFTQFKCRLKRPHGTSEQRLLSLSLPLSSPLRHRVSSS